MIEIEMKWGDKENKALAEMVLNLPRIKKSRLIRSIILMVIGIAYLLAVLLNLNFYPSAGKIGDYIIVALLFFLAFGGIKLIQRIKINKKIKEVNKRICGKSVKYIVSNEGIVISSELANVKKSWSDFNDYGEHKNYIMIRDINGKNMLLDKDKISAEQVAQLKKYCEENIQKADNEKTKRR